MVDAKGTKYLVKGNPGDLLARTLFDASEQPQQVTDDWLATLGDGTPVDFPEIPGQVGSPAATGGGLSPDLDKVGMVLSAQTGAGLQQYVVLKGKVQPVSDFTAWLLLNSPQNTKLGMHGTVKAVDAASIAPTTEYFGAANKWPEKKAKQVNAGGGAAAAGARSTVCSVLRKVDDKGDTTLSTWAGTEYPAAITAGGTSTYVTPGTGLLYTQVQGKQTKPDGSLFLVTDTGLRYAVQANGDSDAARSDIGAA